MESHHQFRDGLGAAGLVIGIAIAWTPAPSKLPAPSPAIRVAVTKGFDKPEAVVYDPGTDFYYVSNVGGPVGIKDGRGFISRVRPDGAIDKLRFIQNGVNDVTLNGPMGSRMRGDTLFVLDIDVLRKFDVKTGRAIGAIDLSGLHPHILNDFDWGPDGAIYVTDMGMIANPQGQPKPGAEMRILKIPPGASPIVALTSKQLATPDGIAWDARAKQFIITPFGGDTVLSWKWGGPTVESVVAGEGKFDGIEVERDGSVYLTSWGAGAMLRLDGRHLAPVVQSLSSPSDVTIDTKRHRAGITEMNVGDLQIWDLTGHVAAK